MRHPLLIEILGALALVACESPADNPSHACMEISGDSCPAPADVDPADLHDTSYCDYEVVEVTSTTTPEPGGNPFGGMDTGDARYCCYEALAKDTDPNSACAIGRPMLVEGAPLLAAVEGEPNAGASDWLQIARMEHASVAAFHKLGLELMAHGAPMDLLQAVARAALEEVGHARMAFNLASRFGGRPLSPGPLPMPAQLEIEGSLARLAANAASEGCVGETLGALLALEGARRATDPEVRAVMEQIAREESQHAALSWRIVAWAIRVGGEPVRDAVREALKAPARLATFSDAPELGLLGPADTQRVVEAGIREVLDPAARVMLAA